MYIYVFICVCIYIDYRFVWLCMHVCVMWVCVCMMCVYVCICVYCMSVCVYIHLCMHALTNTNTRNIYIYIYIYIYLNGRISTPGWHLCCMNPADLISPSLPLIVLAAVRASIVLCGMSTRSQTPNTFAVKHTEVIYAECAVWSLVK